MHLVTCSCISGVNTSKLAQSCKLFNLSWTGSLLSSMKRRRKFRCAAEKRISRFGCWIPFLFRTQEGANSAEVVVGRVSVSSRPMNYTASSWTPGRYSRHDWYRHSQRTSASPSAHVCTEGFRQHGIHGQHRASCRFLWIAEEASRAHIPPDWKDVSCFCMRRVN